MGEVRKIGNTYYIEFYARGLLYSQVAGPDLAAAQILLAETEAKIAGGEALTLVRQIDLPAFFEQFSVYAAKEFGPRSERRFRRAVGHFTGFLRRHDPQAKQLSQITPGIMEAYKAALAPLQKPLLANFTLLLLREFLEYGIKLGFINDNPSLHVRLFAWPQSRQQRPSQRALLAAELFSKGLGIGKVSQLLQLSDIGRVVYYAHLIPLSRRDMYG